MSNLVNGILVGFVVFLLSLSVLWYVLEVRQAADVSAVAVSAEWGKVDLRTTEVSGNVRFKNTHRFDVRIVSVQHEVILNGERVDWDASTNPLLIPASSEEVLAFSAQFPTSLVSQWWPSHFSDGERSRFLVRGNVSIEIGRDHVNRDFYGSFPAATGLESSLELVVENCGQSDLAICIGATRIDFSSAGESGAFESRHTFRNANGTAFRIENLSAVLRLHGIEIARGSGNSSIEIPASSEHEIPLSLTVDSAQVVQWWPLHMDSCERSAVSFTVQFDLVDSQSSSNESEAAGNESVVTRVAWAFDGGTFTTGFMCHE